MNLLTIIILAILVIAAIRGLIRGAVKCILSLAFLVVIIGAGIFVTPHVADYIKGSRNVTQFFNEKCDAVLSGAVDLTQNPVIQSNPVLSQALTSALEGSVGNETVRAEVTEKVTDFLINVTAGAATFLLAMVLWVIIQIIVNVTLEAGSRSAANHILGIPFGLAGGLVTVWLILTVLTVLAGTGIATELTDQFRESRILVFLNQYNPIVRVVLKWVGKAVAAAI